MTNYAVGIIGEEEPREITVDYEYSRKGEKQSVTKTVKGNCLVVLDYENRTSYKIETGIFKGKQDQLNLCDITGDG